MLQVPGAARIEGAHGLKWRDGRTRLRIPLTLWIVVIAVPVESSESSCHVMATNSPHCFRMKSPGDELDVILALSFFQSQQSRSCSIGPHPEKISSGQPFAVDTSLTHAAAP